MIQLRKISLALCLISSVGQTQGNENTTVTPNGCSSQVRIRVYDYAQVPPDILEEGKLIASSIFRKAGVEIAWLDHAWPSDPVQINPVRNLLPDCVELQLRILTQPMAKRLPINKAMTGLTFQGSGGEPGKVANVFYYRVQELSESKIYSKGLILGYATAHELGHLLLGSLDHASTGLMRANWSPKELEKAARGDLNFALEESAKIRREIQRRLHLKLSVG